MKNPPVINNSTSIEFNTMDATNHQLCIYIPPVFPVTWVILRCCPL